ncbi:hypothetical protein LOAG_02253 [Loa loa]|uniref:Uncharacterized protein n=1 Tax=Loa loa TaxID=7209 RepID=A0A1S0U6V5_LOALO|nr:hypothetical protein LOAG_02253 [Loa loa]EFO26227.1 hypothetical protein LOAG_02253 [Loa loa]
MPMLQLSDSFLGSQQNMQEVAKYRSAETGSFQLSSYEILRRVKPTPRYLYELILCEPIFETDQIGPTKLNITDDV